MRPEPSVLDFLIASLVGVGTAFLGCLTYGTGSSVAAVGFVALPVAGVALAMWRER